MPSQSPETLREALSARLRAEGRLDLCARIEKCGQDLALRCLDCQAERWVKTRCDLKWCPACQPALAARTADRFARIAATFTWPLFVTFTVQHGDDDDLQLLRHTRRSHCRLRAQRWWRAAVPAGFICYELTRLGAKARKRRKLGPDNGWHPHGHAILDCRWLAITVPPPRTGESAEAMQHRARQATQEVADQWSMALGRTGQVHVRRVWRSEDGTVAAAVHEVCKYSVKGGDLVELDHPIGPVIDVLDRCRLSTAFGAAYGKPEVKRRRGAPAMCTCGCSSWLPEELLEKKMRHGWL